MVMNDEVIEIGLKNNVYQEELHLKIKRLVFFLSGMIIEKINISY